MRIVVAALFLSLASSAVAKDFRVLNFGDDCRGVTELERSTGSVPGNSTDNGPLYSFNGSYDGWPVTIGYLCNTGRLEKGMYIFERTSFASAAAHYAELKRKFKTMYGAPSTDFASPEFRGTLERTLGRRVADTDTYVSIWETQDVTVQLAVNGPFGGEGWQASVSFETRKKI